MTEEMLEVRAALNPDTNEPLYGTCTLSVGDGSVKVQFTNGRAVAPRSVVERYLVENGALEVPALGIFRSRISEGGAVVQSQESVTATGTKALEDMTPEERIEAALRLSELIAADQGGDTPPAEEEPEEPASTDDASPEDPPAETEQERRIREAKEHLEEEGEEVPEVEAEEEPEEPSPAAAQRVVPAGFDDLTAEGEPRCLAKKGDKSQCKNAAKDGGPACQLEAHAKQFAA